MPLSTPFLSSLFSCYKPDQSLLPADECLLEIRPLLPEWRKEEIGEDATKEIHRSVRKWYSLAPQYLANAASYVDGLKNDFDVYFGVLPRAGRSGSQKDVWYASCLFADVDGGEEGVPGSIARIKACIVPLPNIAVQSGNGIHCYWLLSETVSMWEHSERETFKSTLRRLARAIGGHSPNAHADMSACEVARILRVPGTYNHKLRDNPKEVKVLRHDTADTMTYDGWRAMLPAEPVTKIKKEYQGSYTPAGFISDGLVKWANEGYPEGNRHKDLTATAAWLVRDCKLNKEDALHLLTIKAQHSPGRRAVTERELREMVKWA